MGAPLITVFVRHSADCKYLGDEFCKRCNCRKHFRWTQNGKQYRQKAGTRSWTEAEEVKRRLEDQLAGRAPAIPDNENAKPVAEAIKVFLRDKEVEGNKGQVERYRLEIGRLQDFLAAKGVYVVQRVTRDLLTEFMSTWAETYPSSYTRTIVRARLRCFLRYCFQAQWLTRVPDLPNIKNEEAPTLPLTDEEYTRLVNAIPETVLDAKEAAKVRALIRLMRHSGLALGDALKLERSKLLFDEPQKLYRVVTARQKTGVSVSVPIPDDLAQELLTVLNGNPRYFFVSGDEKADTPRTVWARKYIRPLFEKAKITGDGWMKSHRLRDTFAVDMLQKGVPLEDVSKLLGHESIKTTEKSYAQWVKGRQNRLDSLVTATWKR
jgi:integrase/recombinase XerD